MSNVICFGEVLWDLLPSGKQAGGAPVNCATHLTQLGKTVSVISRVGDDALGAELVDQFSSLGVDMGLVQVDRLYSTGVVDVDLSDTNEVRYTITGPVAWDNIQLQPQNQEAAAGACLVYGTLAAREKQSRMTLHALLEVADTRVCDVNFRPPHYDQEIVDPLLHAADVLKFNEGELSEVAGWHDIHGSLEEKMHQLAQHYQVQEIIVSLGSQGAILLDHGTISHQEVFPVAVKDTIGSGDAFLAGYLVGRMQQLPPAERLRLAAAAGAYVAAHDGATPPMNIKSLEQFLAKRQDADSQSN